MTLAWKVNNLMFDTQMMRLGALQPVRITLWASTNWPSSKARVTSVNSLSRLTRWFSLGTKLRIHKKIKHPNKFWDANNCNCCQYWYDLTTRLKIHMILMTETKLEKHKTCHENPKCGQCGKVFGARRNLRRHENNVHANNHANLSTNSNKSDGDNNGNTPA